MYKKLLLLFLLLLLPNITWAACAGSSPTWTAASASIADISACVTAANPGDTINVPADSKTWTGQLSITKGVKLIGAGIDLTTITYAGDANTTMFAYQPADLSLNTPFRLSGFTFDINDVMNSDNPTFSFVAPRAGIPQTKIRIDHNKFMNMPKALMWIMGMYGVIDNNIYVAINRPIAAPMAFDSGVYYWNNHTPVTYGATDNNIYLEDNIMGGVNRYSGGISYCQTGGRLALRYNTIEAETNQNFMLIDAHGNYGTEAYSCMGYEIYGNQINAHEWGGFFGQRGGKAAVFYNNITATRAYGSSIRDEMADSISPVTSGEKQHVSDTYHFGNKNNLTSTLTLGQHGQDCCVKNGGASIVLGTDSKYYEAFHSYWTSTTDDRPITGANWSSYWAEYTTPIWWTPDNWVVGTDYYNSTCHSDTNCCYNGTNEVALKENVDWYQDNNSFDGTSGIGKGTLSNRPDTCTKDRAAYWATDQVTDNLTGMVGKNPTTPISGTMYRCTDTDTWTPYFTPLAYPHPLRTNKYWVHPSGTAPTWESSSSDTDPGCGSPYACYSSLSQATNNAVAGNIVYLKGGTYSSTGLYEEAFIPANSGTAESKITYIKAPGETPEFVCSGNCSTRGWGIVLNNISYIIIDGLTFTGFTDSALIRHFTNNVEIRNCTFKDGGYFGMTESCLGGSDFNCYVSHLWIHDNSFLRLSSGGSCSEGGDGIRIGYPYGTGSGETASQGLNHHITVENNLIAYMGHAGMDTYGTQLAIRNNVFHNEPWYDANLNGCTPTFPPTDYVNSNYNGKYSHRNWQMSDDFNRDGTWNLVEGNRAGHAGINPNNDGADNFDLASSKNIVRYNSFYNAMQNGLMFKYGPTAGGAIGGLYNRVYNNTIYHNGYGYPYYETCQDSVCPTKLTGIAGYTYMNIGNQIKNNIIYDNRSVVFENRNDDMYALAKDTNTFAGNHCTTDQASCASYGDPEFVNPDLTSPTSLTLPNLNLQATSSAINTGTHLTTVHSSDTGSGTTLKVVDALYFQDGTWGSDLTRTAGTMVADWIAVGTVGNIVQISSIDYTTNTITLANGITRSNGQSIWLYKNSNGKRVLYGSAPDKGAHEYAGAYWVSPTGTAANWSSCWSVADPGGGTGNYCTVLQAKNNNTDGDIVYFKGGSYSIGDDELNMSNSGTLSNGVCTSTITYANAPGETPVLNGQVSSGGIGFSLFGSCLKITGFTLKGFDYITLRTANGASYNEISYCNFLPADDRTGAWKILVGSTPTDGSQCSTHNWFHHNYISAARASDPCTEGIDLVRIGMSQQNPASCDNNNTFEHNYLEYAAHSVLTTHSKHNVLKSNIFHNEPWKAGCTYPPSANEFIYSSNDAGYTITQGSNGHRVIDIGDAELWANNYTLVEKNRIGYGSVNPGNSAAENVSLSSPGNILRYNYIYGAMGSGIYEKWQNAWGAGSGAVRNRIFNNTIYHNGWGFDDHTYGHVNGVYSGQGIASGIYNTCHGGSFDTRTCYGGGCTAAAICNGLGDPVACCTGAGTGPTCETGTCSADATGTVIKNNLLYGNRWGDICGTNTSDANCTPQGYDTVGDNWLNSNGDPLFRNPNMSDPLSQNLFSSIHGYTTSLIPDLTLLSSSPAIDGGAHLTTANGAGNSSKTLIVDDVLYFQDGTWGSDLAKGITYFPDWIAIGSISNVVQISYINYENNTIILDSPMTWADNAPIWLYKNSSGEIVLYGRAPDYGAYEYNGISPGLNIVPAGTSLSTKFAGGGLFQKKFIAGH